jgi:hypothetical protein
MATRGASGSYREDSNLETHEFDEPFRHAGASTRSAVGGDREGS